MKMVVSTMLAASMLAACNSNSKNQEVQLRAQQATIDSMKTAMQKQAIVDSMNAVAAEREENVRKEMEEKKAEERVAASAPSQPAARKSKWNHKAKGALVGAGTGAATGALINKNRAEGAIVGSLIGAGVGVGTGAIVDQQVKKKQQRQQ